MRSRPAGPSFSNGIVFKWVSAFRAAVTSQDPGRFFAVKRYDPVSDIGWLTPPAGVAQSLQSSWDIPKKGAM